MNMFIPLDSYVAHTLENRNGDSFRRRRFGSQVGKPYDTNISATTLTPPLFMLLNLIRMLNPGCPTRAPT